MIGGLVLFLGSRSPSPQTPEGGNDFGAASWAVPLG